MPTQTKDLSYYLGEDISLVDTILQSDGVTPQNITGWSVQFILHALGGGPVLATKTVGAGIVLTTPLSGVLTVTLAAADTSGLDAKLYRYRIERTDPGSDAVLTQGGLALLAK